MRTSHVLAFAAAASLPLSAFAGGAGTTAPASQGSTVLVQATSHAQYKLTPDEARSMAGAFRLDDGRMLTLTTAHSKLFAEFDGKRQELVAVAPDRFVARDSGAQLTFNHVPSADEVVLSQAGVSKRPAW